MTSGLKPSWQGLKGAQDFNNPVEEVVGTIVNWRLEPNHFGDNQVIFTLANCQILKTDIPFPYPDWGNVDQVFGIRTFRLGYVRSLGGCGIRG